MLPVNYDHIPGVYRASFRLPFRINLEKLERFFKGKLKMRTRMLKGLLQAKKGTTYVYVSAQGRVRIYSFQRIRTTYYCKRIAGFKAGCA